MSEIDDERQRVARWRKSADTLRKERDELAARVADLLRHQAELTARYHRRGELLIDLQAELVVAKAKRK